MKIAAEKNNIESIQYLRGIAAVAVLAAHSFEHPLAATNRDILVTGRIGVLLFFAISGFIMAVMTGKAQFDSKSFLIKRFLRVAPYYWLVTLFTAAIALAAPSVFKATTFSMPHLLTSLFFIPFNPNGGSLPLVKLGWTLNYEIFFYIIFALLATLSLSRRVLALFSIFFLLIIIGQFAPPSSSILKFYTNFILVGFVGGAVLGAVYLKIDFRKIPTAAIIAVTVLSSITGIASYVIDRSDDTILPIATLVILTFCISMMIIALWAETTGRLFKSSVLAIFGDASYSIYLVHLFGVGIAVVMAKKLSIPLNGIGYFWVVFGAFSAGLTLGLLAYFFVEKPLINRLRVFLPSKKTIGIKLNPHLPK